MTYNSRNFPILNVGMLENVPLTHKEEYWQRVHAATEDDLAAVNYPALPRAFNRLVDRIFSQAFEEAVSSLVPGRVLEVGCGRARWLRRLEARGWRTCGLDIAPASRADALASALRLPVANESFELAMAITVLQHIADQKIALGELIRVTKSGGRILLIELLDKPGISWQQHVMPRSYSWWLAQFRDAGLIIEQEQPVEYLPLLRFIERIRSGRAVTDSGGSPLKPASSSALKSSLWNLITLVSRPLEPLARTIAPGSASHRLFLLRKP